MFDLKIDFISFRPEVKVKIATWRMVKKLI